MKRKQDIRMNAILACGAQTWQAKTFSRRLQFFFSGQITDVIASMAWSGQLSHLSWFKVSSTGQELCAVPGLSWNYPGQALLAVFCKMPGRQPWATVAKLGAVLDSWALNPEVQFSHSVVSNSL